MKLDLTKNAVDNVLALINAANGTSIVNGRQIALGSPVAFTGPGGQNTKLNVAGVPGDGVSGNKDLYYNRIGIAGSAASQASTMQVDITMTAADFKAAVASAWHLMESELQDIVPPASGTPSLNFAARPDSLTYIGSGSINLSWVSVVPSQPYGLFFSGNHDDDFTQLPLVPFDFHWFGHNLRFEKSFGVGANSFVTLAPDTTYDAAVQADPAHWTVPTLCIGAADRSVQQIFAGTQSDGTYKIRFEGWYTYSGGVVGTPSIVWELVFSPDGTFTLFTDAPQQVPAYYGTGSNWILFNGTPAAVHPYNGTFDANFTIPIVQGQTFKFSPSDANGTTFNCVQV